MNELTAERMFTTAEKEKQLQEQAPKVGFWLRHKTCF